MMGMMCKEKMHVDSEPTFLSYLQGISRGDSKEFVDCLLFLKLKQEEADQVDIILKQVEGHAVDANTMMELRQICESYGIDVGDGNDDTVKACLEEEKEFIRIEMHAADMGFEPDNLYSAVDVVQTAFDGYGQTCMREDTDMTEELRKVLAWIGENEEYFHPVD